MAEFLLLEQSIKSRAIPPGPCADDSVYRLTGARQENSNTHPFTARLLRWGIDGPSLDQPEQCSAMSAAFRRA